MPTISATVVMQCELAGAGAGWTDITADTRIGVNPLTIDYGITGSGPLDRVATTGVMSWAMDNSTSNSGGVVGYYSPGHTNARAGWDIGIGVRCKLTYGGTDYYKGVGTLITVIPDAGQYLRQAVICTVVDWMDEAATTRIRGIGIQTNQRSDQIINTIVSNSVVRQPAATSYDTGQSTFAIALDNMNDTQTPVLAALADTTISELGYLYVKGGTTGGVLKFEDRHARPKFGAAVGSFDETMVALTVTRSRADIINRVYVVVHPRTTAGSASVLYELTTTDSVPSIAGGNTIQITAPFREASIKSYRVAGTSVITPVSGTDWIANTASDGSGSVITSDVAVTLATTAANAVTFNIVNNGTVTAYLTTLQVRGTEVADISNTVMSAADATSATTYGERDSRVDMKYESNAGEFAFNIAEWILAVYKDPRYVIQKMSIVGNTSAYLMAQALAREPGDKITLAETMTGIAETGASSAEIGYFINGCQFSVSAGGIIRVSWILSPAEQQNAWILQQVGASELGISTVLGFA
jgi:hypothetical protein